MRLFPLAIITLLMMGSCSGNRARITGRIVASQNDTLMLEHVIPGAVNTIDTALLDSKGRFSFKVKLDGKTPGIYNVRAGKEVVSLVLAPGDKARLNALGRLSGSYTVEGSPESERMHDLRMILALGNASLDSILSVYARADDAARPRISMQYTDKYYAIKREQIQFIVSDPGSIASLYALYQRLPNDKYLADGHNEIVYYQLVADSADVRYPGSPYVAALKSEIAAAGEKDELAAMISSKMNEEAPPFPDLDMPDIYGMKHKMSDLIGRVIVLDFWSTSIKGGELHNAEMKELYERYADSGLAIYQVCVDESRNDWVSAVRNQQIPWISVNDLKGSASRAVQVYNVHSIPSNYVIDRQGHTVARDLYGDSLGAKIKELL